MNWKNKSNLSNGFESESRIQLFFLFESQIQIHFNKNGFECICRIKLLDSNHSQPWDVIFLFYIGSIALTSLHLVWLHYLIFAGVTKFDFQLPLVLWIPLDGVIWHLAGNVPHSFFKKVEYVWLIKGEVQVEV